MVKKVFFAILTIFMFTVVGCSLIGADKNSVSVVEDPLITTSFGADRCSDCHENQYKQWQENAHAKSLETLSKISYAQDRCTEHMTAKGVLASPGEEVTLKNVKHGITCVVCHLPHKGREGFLLRLPKQELCISCHNAEGPKLGSDVHHSQKEMFMGYGGVGLVESPSKKYQIGISCSDCHMPLLSSEPEAQVNASIAKEKWPELLNRFLEKGSVTLENGNYLAKDVTRLASHDFAVQYDEEEGNSCKACHPNESIKNFQEQVESRQSSIATKLAELEARINAITEQLEQTYGDKLPTEEQWSEGERLYFEAKLNFQIVSADGSNGFHNYEYAQKLLQVADKKLTASERSFFKGGSK
ncbi:ammonia-forming cytochrome c nitrite reductase subunit c552 [Metallumcola ferriviriculae]|uniref:Ammonia-forming cytochrome c nitrite reductase subunit c552 n=1 Tax=Metallumcola ferriviriculae TaxID=3039180 RepID=A0AAU0UT14_9FIRM|nr:ammonia-forming cytochrome c nitrite reductase subunit c552 [Desulfitibacteraceae bacterium MK1]